MKKFMFIIGIALTFFLFSCEKDITGDDLIGGNNASGCNGKGYLSVTNRSVNTVQRLMVDGVNYGSLDPDRNMTVSLPAGYHSWQLVGISGGGGCSEAMVIITECETASYECRGK
jgi:hypothetical protein